MRTIKVAKSSSRFPYKLPKNVTVKESEKLDELFKDKPSASPGRKRPRNLNEEKVLKRWEKERGGRKIGDI